MGTDPSGTSYTSVKARIANLETSKSDTSHNHDHNTLNNLTVGDPHTQYLLKSIGTAKGDLLAFTGSAAPARVGVGTNDYTLLADSTQAAGVRWGTPIASLTTAQRDALAAGQRWAGRIIWNTTTGQHERYDGTAWGALASSTTTLTIVETATGVWSADAPVRTAGVNPIRFIGADDPADPTNGINTPANINDFDTWTRI